jgi:hypothetical protein
MFLGEQNSLSNGRENMMFYTVTIHRPHSCTLQSQIVASSEVKLVRKREWSVTKIHPRRKNGKVNEKET